MRLWPFSTPSTKSESHTLTPFSAASLAQLLVGVFGGGATKSGASVNTDTALQVAVVLSCVRVLAEGVAQVPFKLMRATGRVRDEQRTHPLWSLLHRKPNRWQTSFAFRETLMLHVLLGPTGSAYAFKSRVGSDRRLAELILLDPKRVKEHVADDGTRRFEVRGKNGGGRTLTDDDVWVIAGPSWEGTTAMPLVKLAREAIGLAMSTEESQANLQARGVQSSGTYTVDGTLSPQGYKDLKTWIEKEFAGAKAAGRPMVLGGGAKWNPMSITPVDAQHLETRKHQVEEVCRCFRVLPIMVGQADKAATYASAEQMFLAHLVHTLMPWYERLEQSADVALLSDREIEQGYYTLLEPTGMLRGSLKDTADYISRLTDRGVITRNEGREMLDRNPLDGLDTPLTPTNLTVGDPTPAAAEGTQP